MVRTRLGPVAAVVVLAVTACSGAEGASSPSTSSPRREVSSVTRATTSSTTNPPPPPTSTADAGPTDVPAEVTSAPDPAGHVFPVQPASAASYDPSHHDYPAADIFAPCGSTVVAVTDGVVDEVSLVDEWSSANDTGVTRSGLLVSIVGDDGVRYYGSHLAEVAPGIDAGVRVAEGGPIGSVGDTGNARGSGCHLHFGLSAPCGPGDWERRRGEVWPQPYLDSWRTGADAAPAAEISSRRC